MAGKALSTRQQNVCDTMQHIIVSRMALHMYHRTTHNSILRLQTGEYLKNSQLALYLLRMQLLLPVQPLLKKHPHLCLYDQYVKSIRPRHTMQPPVNGFEICVIMK